MSFVKMGMGVALFGLAAAAMMVGCAVAPESDGAEQAEQAGEERAAAPVNEETGEAEQALDNGTGPTGSGSVCDAQCHVLIVNCEIGGYLACIPWSQSCKIGVDNGCTGGAYATCMSICRSKSGTVGGGIAH